MENNYLFKIDLEKYPNLKTVKKDELNNYIEKIFDYGYKLLHPEITEKALQKEQIEQMSKQEILNSINFLRSDICEMDLQDKLDNLSGVLEKFLGLSQNSNKKGEITEDIIYQLFNAKYKDLSYEKTRDIPHSGDGILTFPIKNSSILQEDKLKVMVEIKNYTATVKKEEVDKFKYDLKYNNINYGLFISLKSSIQGYAQLDYEKMIHDNQEYNMIYISHIDADTTKIDSALLVLQKLYEIEGYSKKKDIDWIHKQINTYFKELVNLSEKTTLLKDNFVEMESNIKNSLNDHYKILRDYQYDINKQINNVWDKINDDFGKAKENIINQDQMYVILNQYSEDKCYSMLARIFDILFQNGIVLSESQEDRWDLIWQDSKTGDMKKTKNKLAINLINPQLSFNFIRNNDYDDNLKFLNIVLNSLK